MAICSLTGPGLAQGTAPAVAPDAAPTGSAQSASLSRTNHQDWVVECVEPPVDGIACQVSHTVLYGAERAPVFVVAIAEPRPQVPMEAVFVLPLNIALRDGLTLAAGEETFNMPFDRCTAGGCIAQARLDPGLMALMTSEASGVAVVTRDGGEPFRIPVSFAGFSAALEAMQEQNARVSAAR